MENKKPNELTADQTDWHFFGRISTLSLVGHRDVQPKFLQRGKGKKKKKNACSIVSYGACERRS